MDIFLAICHLKKKFMLTCIYEFLTGRVQSSSSFMIKYEVFNLGTKMQVFYEYVVSVQSAQRTE